MTKCIHVFKVNLEPKDNLEIKALAFIRQERLLSNEWKHSRKHFNSSSSDSVLISITQFAHFSFLFLIVPFFVCLRNYLIFPSLVKARLLSYLLPILASLAAICSWRIVSKLMIFLLQYPLLM